MKLKQLLPFLILLQDIEHEAPGYILEKFNACLGCDDPSHLLDLNNLKILYEYAHRWRVKDYTASELMRMQKIILGSHVDLQDTTKAEEIKKPNWEVLDEDDGYCD